VDLTVVHLGQEWRVERLAIEQGPVDAAGHAARILDMDVKRRRAIAQDELESGPAGRDPRVEAPGAAAR